MILDFIDDVVSGDTKELKEYLDESVVKIIELDSTFKDHIDDIRYVRIVEASEYPKEAQNAYGWYNPKQKDIYIVFDHVKDEHKTLQTLLHEVGHHVCIHHERDFNFTYNSNSKNQAYYQEEIKADKYSLKLLELVYESLHGIIDYVRRRLDYFREKLSKAYVNTFKWNNSTSIYTKVDYNLTGNTNNSATYYTHWGISTFSNYNTTKITGITLTA